MSKKNIGQMKANIRANVSLQQILSSLTKAHNKLSKKLLERKVECSHEVLILLGTDGARRLCGPSDIYVCLECGTTFKKYENSSILGFPPKESIVLDFSKNPSRLLRSENTFDYVIVDTIRKALSESAEANPEMTIEDFIGTIPENWYTDSTVFEPNKDKKK